MSIRLDGLLELLRGRAGASLMRIFLVFGACAFFAAVGVYDAATGNLPLGAASLCVAAANALFLTA